MKPILVFLLLCIILMNGGIFTLGLKEDANMMVSGSGSGSCVEKERQVLVILKNHLDVYGNLSDWGSKEEKKDCCQWVGVYCDHTGHVIKLDIHDKGLNGHINVSLGDLNFLTHLDLSNNNLNGSIPELTGCSSMSYLKLSSNKFIGDIPSSLGQLSKLHYLDVSDNSLNGNIPEFTGCPFLSTLDVSYNNLNGSIPELTGCSSMSYLDLSSNNFTGDIPSSLGQFSKLDYLNVSDNSLNGNIPEFTGCPSLSTLALSSNNFTGDLPNSLGQLTNLYHLDVSSNSLDGVISDLHFQCWPIRIISGSNQTSL